MSHQALFNGRCVRLVNSVQRATRDETQKAYDIAVDNSNNYSIAADERTTWRHLAAFLYVNLERF
jgi:hypothetical protein